MIDYISSAFVAGIVSTHSIFLMQHLQMKLVGQNNHRAQMNRKQKNKNQFL